MQGGEGTYKQTRSHLENFSRSCLMGLRNTVKMISEELMVPTGYQNTYAGNTWGQE
jgi:hypothetical protein